MIMKKIKIFPLLFAAITFIFAACSNVDDPKPNENDNGNGGNEQNDGTKTKPYSIQEIISMNPQSTTEAVKSGVWMKGYIVGYYNNENKTLETTAPFTKDENIMMAADPNETNMSKCVCVQVPFGDVRDALGLATKPENIKKEIMIYGDVMKYNTYPGIKNTIGYWFIQEDTGLNPPVPEFDVEEISISELRGMWSGASKKITENKKIVGVVISDLEGGNSTSLKNFTIAAVDNAIGIQIRINESSHSYNLGDKIEINVKDVTLDQYAGALQLANFSLIKTRKIATADITPRVTTIAELKSNFSNYESTLITITGTITSENTNGTWGSSSKNQNNTVTKDGETMTAFVARYASFINEVIPTEEKQITGIAGRFDDTYQIIIRNLNDVK